MDLFVRECTQPTKSCRLARPLRAPGYYAMTRASVCRPSHARYGSEAQLYAHIPDRFEHLVRYAGWYSNRSRGKPRRMAVKPAEVALREAKLHEARRVRSTWAPQQGPKTQIAPPAHDPPGQSKHVLTYQ